MNSCLYDCRIHHKRIEPRKHEFTYRIFMMCLDLDELDEVSERIALFSHNRPNVYSFYDRDHLDLGKPTLKENVLEYLRQHDVVLPAIHRILLVTLPRVLGYVFNPVSFYYCYNSMGEALCAVVQVGNTFRELKPYIIQAKDGHGVFRLITPKYFYVSPFSELDLDFDFRLRSPGERLEVRIDDLDGRETRILTTNLHGDYKPLTNVRLTWMTLKYPFITLKVIFLIHWNALLLWLRWMPWYRKAANPEDQRDVFNPHDSIARKAP